MPNTRNLFLFVGCLGAEVVLETLSHSPRVFSLYNFMDMEEADNIIEDALGMTQDAYRLKVGAGDTVLSLPYSSYEKLFEK